jgi:hypothetical protein
LAIAASKQAKESIMEKRTVKKVAAGASRESAALTKEDVAMIAAAVAKELNAPIAKALQRQTAVLASVATKLEEMELDRIAAGTVEAEMIVPSEVQKAAGEEDDDEGQDEENEGKKHGPDEEDDQDDDDIESEGIDKGDLEELGPDLGDGEFGDKPGEEQKDTRNHGSDTKVQDKQGPIEKKAELGGSAYVALKKRFTAMANQLRAMEAQNQQLSKKVKKLAAQGVKISAEIDRRSVLQFPADVNGLLRKSNYDPREIAASGPLTVEQVDAMLGGFPGLSIPERMTLKNKLLEAGGMDQGAMERGYGSR